MDKQFLTQVTQRISGLAFGSILAVSAVFLAVSPTAALASATENAAQAPIQQELAPFVADYVAYRHGDDVGYARLELKSLSANQYALTYRSRVSKFFLSDKRHEHSIFTLQDNNIVPGDYFYERGGTGPDKSLNAKFDGNQNAILIDGVKLKDWQGELDNQLFRIDVPRQLMQGKTSMQYSFINYRGEPREYKISVVANEQLELPYGVLDSVKLKINRGSSSRETFAWFSPSLDYALVRLQQFKDGKEQGDIKLKSFQRNPQ